MRNKSWIARLSGLTVAAVILVVCGASPAVAVDPKTAQRIDVEIEKIRLEIIKFRRFIHMNPELGYHEIETAKLVGTKLASLGLEVRTGVAGTGVTGLLRGNPAGQTVAVRADMDALPIQELTNVPYKSLNPGAMHACGHDVHTTIVLGTAMVLNALKDKVEGNVKFIFQPAEEGAPEGGEAGASLMIKEGVLDEPAVGAIFGLHVWPDTRVGHVNFSSGPIMASADHFEVAIKGKSAHGARPHEGVDAIVVAAEAIAALQFMVSRFLDPTDPAVLTIGKIEGGVRDNIIADKVTFSGTVRTLSETNRKKVPRLMENVIKGVTQSFGATYALDYKLNLPSVYNHPELAATMLPTLTNLLGGDNVEELKPQMVAEDFSFYAQKIPGFFFFLGVKNPAQPTAAGLHSPYFNPDERSIPLGIKMMCHLLLDALEQQSAFGAHSPSD